MKIDGWHIDGYGVHADRSDRDLPGGLTVVQGPNESGKSTLADFLVGMLFGFTPVNRPDHHAPLRGGTYGGRLFVTDASGRPITISRGARQSSLRLTDADGELPTAELAQLLGGATKDLYLSIFAVHVEEVAELRALTDDQVRDRVFSAGVLGAGRTAQQALSQLAEQRDILWKPTGRGDRYELKALRARLGEARAALGEARQQALELPALVRRLDDVDHEAAGLASKAEQLRADQRHRASLIEVWAHWAEADAARRSLAALGDAPAIAPELARRIHASEDLLAERTTVATVARTALDAAQAALASLAPVGPIMGHAATVTELAAEAPVEDERAERIADLEQRVHATTVDLDGDLRRLGPGCDRAWLTRQPRHLEADAHLRQVAAAVTDARHRRDDAATNLANAIADAESESGALDAERAELDRHPQIDVRRAAAGRDHAIRLRTLVDQHDAARRRLDEAGNDVPNPSSQPGVPRWAPPALAGLAASALIGALVAVATGAPIAGGMSAVVAVAAVALALALRGTNQGPVTTGTNDTRRSVAADEMARIHNELDPVLTALGLDAVPTPAHAAAVAAKAEELADRAVETAQAHRELDQRTRATQERTVRLLAARRAELDHAERTLADATIAWREWLTQRQLPAGLDPEAAGEHLALVARAHDRADHLERANAELDHHRHASTAYGQRVLDLADELPEHLTKATDPHPTAVARLLAVELADHQQRQHALDEAQRAATQAELAHHEATQRQQEAAADLAAALAEIGVGSIEAAHARLDQDRAATKLQACIDRAELALTTAFGNDPDRLAAARHHLTHDDPATWHGDLERIATQLNEVLAARDESLRHRSLLGQQIEELGRSRDVPRCELQVADLEAQLVDAVRQWAALTVAHQLVEGTLARYQRERQPAVIRRAAELFAQITDGRYHRLEVRDRDIVAVDRTEREVPASGLSRGTVEQLYLCMRFALAESFSATAALPLLLDDVTVNADGERHPRLAQVIAEVARNQQVLVFTGHATTVAQLQAHTPDARVIELPPSEGPAQFNLVAGA
jgi:uncharacterized protein YhaN